MTTDTFMKRTACAVLGALLCGGVFSSAQEIRSAVEFPEVKHDQSPPLRDIPPQRLGTGPQREMRRPLPTHPIQPAPFQPDSVLQSSFGTSLIPSPAVNFEGIGAGFTGPSGTFSVNAAPPDTNGAVGPNHYVQTVNTDLAVFNKTGTPLYGPVPINTLWTGFGGGCQTNNDGDPSVLYDKIADRWVVVQFSVSTTPYLMCVAVSQTSDPTGAYNRYAFSYGNIDFPDYPKLGIWPDAYYLTTNIFTNGSIFAGARVCAMDRSKMLAGQAATQQCFGTSTSWGSLLPSDLDGSRLPPAGSPNYLLAFGTNNLGVWKFHVDWTTPVNSTFSGPTILSVAAFSEACGGGTCIPQSGTTQKLDSLGDRLMYRLAYRNFSDHESLVSNHSITAGSSVGVRWYELQLPGGVPTLFQQGTYAPDSSFRWMGSIAMDSAGDMGLGFSVSSSTLHPEIHYTGRLAGDAAGQMTQGEGAIIDGAGSQSGSSLSRWGDYSSMSVDPTDDCTFWYTTEYLASTGAFNWHTRIGAFKFSSCGSANPNLSLSTASLALASTVLGQTSPAKTVKLTSSGSSDLHIASIVASGNFSVSSCPATLTPGSSCTISVTFSPTSLGSITGAITITDDAPGSPHLVKLTGSGITPITMNPASLSFGTVTVGTPSPQQTVNVVNNSTSGVTIAFTTSGDYTAVPGSTSGCGSSLAAKTKCTLSVTFNPGYNGTIKGDLTTTHSAAFSPQVVSLTGAGTGGSTPPLTFSPTALSFGKVLVGTTSLKKTVTVTNASGGSLTINSFIASGDYAVTPGATSPCGGALGASASCTVSVTFSPTVTGGISGAITFSDSAAIGVQNYSLSGTGLAPVTFSPTSLLFASQAVGTTSPPQTVTVFNNQPVVLTLSGFVASGDFNVISGGANPCGASIAAKGSCTVQVTFSPSFSGTITGAITFTDTASTSPQTLKVTGTAP